MQSSLISTLFTIFIYHTYMPVKCSHDSHSQILFIIENDGQTHHHAMFYMYHVRCGGSLFDLNPFHLLLHWKIMNIVSTIGPRPRSSDISWSRNLSIPRSCTQEVISWSLALVRNNLLPKTCTLIIAPWSPKIWIPTLLFTRTGHTPPPPPPPRLIKGAM